MTRSTKIALMIATMVAAMALAVAPASARDTTTTCPEVPTTAPPTTDEYPGEFDCMETTVPEPTTTPATSTPSEPHPNTGFDLVSWITLGAVLVAVGLAASLLARRKMGVGVKPS